MRVFSFLVITTTGFSASVAQIIVLRELLVLFYGNELSTGLIFAPWLLWTAAGSSTGGRLCRKIPSPYRFLPWLLLLLSFALIATVLWIRASRIIWSISAGEIIPFSTMVAISISSTSLFCTASGFVFALAWSAYMKNRSKDQAPPTVIYLGETMGTALGGILFFYFLLPYVSTLFSALFVSLVLVSVAVILFMRKAGTERALSGAILSSVIVVIILVGMIFSARLEKVSRHWLWGPDLVSVRDTPFQNLAVLKSEDQYTLFGNGLWLFSIPDMQTAEYAVHLALLQHVEPRSVLLIGGGVGGLITETLKHPSVVSVDYVEPDPDVIRLAMESFPSSVTQPLNDDRVHLFHKDAASFVNSASRAYDVVLMSLGDPLNAEMNRFFTVEFFERVSRLLNRGGVFSVGVSSSPDIVGAKQARLLRSVYITLQKVFPGVLVIPGATARFVAAIEPDDLVADPLELIRRIQARRLQLQFVREYYLFDYMNPMRIAYLSSILKRSESSEEVNRDLRPTCYINNLIVWSEQIQPLIAKVLQSLLRVPSSFFLSGTATFVLAVLGFFQLFKAGPRAAVSLCVLVVGGVQIGLEIALLLGFQILEGFVYTELALIISFFMAGMAVGTAVSIWFKERLEHIRLQLFWVQIALSFYIVGLLGLLFIIRHFLNVSPQTTPPLALLFSLFALIAGSLGGLHFSLAVQYISDSGESPSAEIGAGLYGLDLAGAAIGALATSLFFLPIYGLPVTLCALALLTMGSGFTLLQAAVRHG